MTEVAIETLCILGFGSFLGYLIWGLLGFGAGIIVVCSWTVFSSCGLNAGPLRLAVGADSICSIIIAIPFVYLTNSCTFGDYGVFMPIVIFRNLANSIGAYLFQELDVSLLELIVAPILFVLVVVKYATEFCIARRQRAKTEAKGAIEKDDESDEPLLGNSSNEDSDDKEDFPTQDVEKVIASPESPLAQEPAPTQFYRFGFLSATLNCFLHHIRCIWYMFTCRSKVVKSSVVRTLYLDFQIVDEYLTILFKPSWLWALPILCSGSFLSGIVGSMSGAPGPPLIYTFQLLNVPKDVARANASVAKVLDLRVIFYFLYGSLDAEYWRVYAVTVSCGFLGLLTGNFLAKKLNTQSYYHFLMALVLVSGVLLLLRGVGVLEEP